eukprot:s1761_g9.t1
MKIKSAEFNLPLRVGTLNDLFQQVKYEAGVQLVGVNVLGMLPHRSFFEAMQVGSVYPVPQGPVTGSVPKVDLPDCRPSWTWPPAAGVGGSETGKIGSVALLAGFVSGMDAVPVGGPAGSEAGCSGGGSIVRRRFARRDASGGTSDRVRGGQTTVTVVQAVVSDVAVVGMVKKVEASSA